MMLHRRAKQRICILGGMSVLVLWWGYSGLIVPARQRVQTLQRLIPQKKEELSRLNQLSGRYEMINNKLGRVNEQINADDGFEIIANAEKLIKACELQQRVRSMNQQVIPFDQHYSQVVVDLSMNRLSMSELVDFLRGIRESDTRMRIKNLSVKRQGSGGQWLDVQLQLSILKS